MNRMAGEDPGRRRGAGVFNRLPGRWAAIVLATALCLGPPAEAQATADFIRGDSDQTGTLSLSDAITILSYLIGSTTLACDDAADSNDDGAVSVADVIYLLGFLFAGGAPPPPPSVCSTDPTVDTLSCASYSPCP